MLSSDTKRKIDSARDILVGKVPDPKAQVEQITTALIYKFMDDMDKEAQEIGGKARFFTNGYEKYAWTKLMDPKLGGHDRLDLYVESLTQLSLNPHIPQLFRDIFKDAFLPYRNPETLSLFIKEINGFSYVHSEDLGDAFEYLLSILGSQGDAGQFRTPRHIIDFIVAAVDPKKDDVICDPACGTAGFLISAYKHILRQHDGKDDPKNKEKPLTPDDKKQMMNHFVGYDISPDMVKLSKVNMYLHGFPEPKIYEYDTLSSEERWEDSFDVMLANPPFMTPKGGIKPHKRFSVQANRAEVLFVDYIKEHLRPNGRAGIIVPEGIIFQSGTAYKQLRKLLVEDGLFAVVSLPAGVFNPYAGVKTSILFLDNQLAKQSDSILFIKIDNDGYGLGAQRREIDKNDLPLALTLINSYKRNITSKNLPQTDKLETLTENTISIFVPKSKISDLGDYYLTGDRYREINVQNNQKWSTVELGLLTELFVDGNWIETKDQSSGGIRLIQTGNIGLGYYIDKKTERSRFISEDTFNRLNCTEVFPGDVLVSRLPDPVGRACIVPNIGIRMITAVDCTIIRFKKDRILPEYFIALSKSSLYFNELAKYLTGSSRRRISRSNLGKINISLPPIEVQKEIVEQIETKLQAIEHAKAIIQNLERERGYFGQLLRKLEGLEWKGLGTICENMDSKRKPVTKSGRKSGAYPYYGASGIVDYVADYIFDGDYLLVSEDGANLIARSTPIAFSISGKNWVNNHAHILKFSNSVTQKLVEFYLNSIDLTDYITGSAQPKLNQENLNKIKIPIPSLEIQKRLVADITEQIEIIKANQRLIEIMEKKIQEKISEI